MTSFVNIKYSRQHPGVARVESAIDAVKELRQGFSGTRGLAALLLSAIVAAVMVVAYQVMDSVAEGHLLAMWIGLWVVAFAVLALFASAARPLAARVVAALDAWSHSIAQARADIRMWEAAKTDPRVMADLRVAMARQESTMEEAAASAPLVATVTAAVPAGLTKRAIRMGGAELRAYQRNYI